MISDVQKLQAYLEGDADPQTMAEIEAQLKDPDNQFDRFFRGLRERSLPGPAFWGGFPPNSGINYDESEDFEESERDVDSGRMPGLDPASQSRGGRRFFVTGRRRYWAPIGIAASLLLAVGLLTYQKNITRVQPLREAKIAAWAVDVTSKRIAAADEDPDQVTVADRLKLLGLTGEASKSLPPAFLAPVSAQESLVPRKATASAGRGSGANNPISTVVSKVTPECTFYVTLRPPADSTPGSAVLIRMGVDKWEKVASTFRVSPDAVINVIGPVMASNKTEDFLVIVADKNGTLLDDSVASCLPTGGSRPEQWRPALANALKMAGHEWYSLQVVRVEWIQR